MANFYNPMMKTPDFGQGFGDIINQIMQMLMIKKMYPDQGGQAANAPVATGNTQGAPQLMPMGGQPSASMAPPPPRPGAMMGGAGGGGMAGAMGGGQPGGGAGMGGMNPDLLRMLMMALMGKGGGIPGMGR